MGIFDFLRRPPESKESAVGATLVMSPGQPAWSNRDYRAFADEGYRRNVVAYQAINKAAEAVASVEVELFRGDTQVTEHPLLTLLDRPNPMQDYAQYAQSLVGFYLLSGNGYQERVTGAGREPRELYAHRPDRMKVVPGSNGMPQAYVYDVNGKKTYWEVDDVTGESDLSQMKAFNPLDDWYGMSPIEAAAYSIDTHNDGSNWVKSLLQNSARPSGALVQADDKTMTDEQFHRLKKQVEEQYSGAANAGRPMLLEGGLDWKSMGLSPNDMAILETKNASAREICLAIGVPPQLLGIPGDNTYSNYKEARLAFWEDTVIPLIGTVFGEWNRWLVPAFGDGLELRPNMDSIPAIVDKRMQLWQMADASQDLTLNERRELKGYEPIDGGDTIMLPANLIPMDSGFDMSDIKAAAALGGYPENVTPIDRKVK